MGQPQTLSVAAALIDIDLTVLIQFALFLVMFGVTSALLWKPFMKLREQRLLATEGARDEATRMSSEADGKLADYEQKLGIARAKAAEETRKIRAEAAAYEREVTDQARTAAGEAIGVATTKMRADTETARSQLMPQADALAAAMAKRLLGREVA